MVLTMRAIDYIRNEDSAACCDTKTLAARLGWPRGDVQRALYDARLSGYIVGRVTSQTRVDLADIKLKPDGVRLLRRMPRHDTE